MVSGEGTKFLYEGQQIIAEYNGAGALQRRYIPGPGLDNPYVWFEGTGTASSTARRLLGNAFGSIIAVGSTGAANTTLGINSYDEFGVGPTTNLGRFQYKGMALIPELGLYHARARTYSQYLGRFMQPDPSGYSDGMNLYAFVHNGPVGSADPLGLTSECKKGKGEDLACEVEAPRPPPDDPSPASPPSDFPTTDPPAPGTDEGGGGCGRQPQGPKQVDCDTVLPNGQTVGDVVRAQQAQLQRVLDSALQSEGGPLSAELGTFLAISFPNGPIDFKNRFRGQANASVLGSAGNFAYYAVGSGYIPSSLLDFGAGTYAVAAAVFGRKPFSSLTGPMFADASAAAVRNAALASNGCHKP